MILLSFFLLSFYFSGFFMARCGLGGNTLHSRYTLPLLEDCQPFYSSINCKFNNNSNNNNKKKLLISSHVDEY